MDELCAFLQEYSHLLANVRTTYEVEITPRHQAQKTTTYCILNLDVIHNKKNVSMDFPS